MDSIKQQFSKQIQEFIISNKSIYYEDIIYFLIEFNKSIRSRTQKNIIQFIQESFQEEMYLVFIRHGQSSYNQWKKQSIFNWSIFYSNKQQNYDPSLTEEGKIQCKQLCQKSENIKIKFTSVYVSPLSRAIQTFLEINHHHMFSQVENLQLLHLLRERMDTVGDIGKPLSKLKNNFEKKIDFKLLEGKEFWWRWHKQDCSHKEILKFENDKAFKARITLLIIYLLMSSNGNICIISHSQLYQFIANFERPAEKQYLKNADIATINYKTLIKIINSFYYSYGQL